LLQVYEGYLEKGQIIPIIPFINTQDRRRVIITVLDEPHRDTAFVEEARLRAQWLDRLEESVRLSMDEDLHFLPRSKEMRKPLGLSD
jgi:hypothetical protein